MCVCENHHFSVDPTRPLLRQHRSFWFEFFFIYAAAETRGNFMCPPNHTALSKVRTNKPSSSRGSHSTRAVGQKVLVLPVVSTLSHVCLFTRCSRRQETVVRFVRSELQLKKKREQTAVTSASCSSAAETSSSPPVKQSVSVRDPVLSCLHVAGWMCSGIYCAVGGTTLSEPS